MNRRYIMIYHLLLKKRAAFPEISPVSGVLYSNGSRNPNCCNWISSWLCPTTTGVIVICRVYGVASGLQLVEAPTIQVTFDQI